MRTEKFSAWAINTRSDEEHGLIGRYWWFANMPPKIPSHLEGCHIALFKTRKVARENLSSVKRAFESAVVVKVQVTISTYGKNSENIKEEINTRLESLEADRGARDAAEKKAGENYQERA